MKYKWKPNAGQKAAFKERMQDPKEQEAYEKRKEEKRSYDYWKDKDFIPTQEQFEFCMRNLTTLFVTGFEKTAAESVIYGYTCQERIPHDDIHIVNELRRKYPQS